MTRLSARIILFTFISFTHSLYISAQEFSGYISAEGWLFANDPIQTGQKQNNLSFAAQPEIYYEWENQSSFTFVPFARINDADPERSHFDIRELNYLWVKKNWELSIGIDKVFWGVTEFVHLVDIINQTDLVESIDLEEKLGQPMAHLIIPRNWGIVELLVLPYFRERTFPGRKGRLRFPVIIDTDNTVYESSAKEKHVDFALRYSHTIGNLDIGVSHFRGTGREPTFLFNTNEKNEQVIIPFYEQIDQTGLDLQLVAGNWLFKNETLYRTGQGDSFFATIGGFEYAFSGLAGTKTDLRIFGEWVYDDRGSDATTFYDNDVMFGLRFELNDLNGTDVFIGMAQNVDNPARVGILEANRRIGSNWKLTLIGWGFFSFPTDDAFYSLRKDDFLQLEVTYYF